MMDLKPRTYFLIASGVQGLAIVLQVVALTTTRWMVMPATSHNNGFYLGLWHKCVSEPVNDCFDLTGSSMAVEVGRGFGVLAVLLMLVSYPFAVLTLYMKEENLYSLLSPISAAVGSLCSMVEFSLYAGKFSEASDYFGFSFVASVLSSVLGLVAATLLLRGWKETIHSDESYD